MKITIVALLVILILVQIYLAWITTKIYQANISISTPAVVSTSDDTIQMNRNMHGVSYMVLTGVGNTK